MNVLEKTGVLISVYGSQENLNFVLKAVGTNLAKEVLKEPKPVPPLKKRVRFGKIELVLDEQDTNYLLSLSRYVKRQTIASRIIQNDTNLQDNAYRLMITNHTVETNYTQSDFENYIMLISDDLAGVTPSETDAIIPDDETL